MTLTKSEIKQARKDGAKMGQLMRGAAMKPVESVGSIVEPTQEPPKTPSSED